VFFNDKPSSYWGTPIYGNFHSGFISIYGTNGVITIFFIENPYIWDEKKAIRENLNHQLRLLP
jgi:hypothetical protein